MKECKEKIERFIKKCGYTYKSAWDIVEDYDKYYKKGYYCSYTMNICIKNNLNEVKFLWKYLKKRNRI